MSLGIKTNSTNLSPCPLTFQVHADGLITFGKEPSSITTLRHRKYPLPSQFPTIAPFYAPVTVEGEGHVFYRLSRERKVLTQATADVRSSFWDQDLFNASLAFVATWSRVKHVHGKFAKEVSNVSVKESGLEVKLFVTVYWEFYY